MKAHKIFGSSRLILILLLLVGGLTASAVTYADSILPSFGLVSEGSLFSGFSRSEPSTVQNVTDATVSTDKQDYRPGETVIITASGFAAGEQVRFEVDHVVVNSLKSSLESNLADHAGHDPWYVNADSSGNVSTSWLVQEDSLNQTLILTADGMVSTLHAETIFTDSAVAGYNQCANDDGDGIGGDPGLCTWTNGNLQKNNSTYSEGEATVQRLWLTDLAAGSPHTLTLKYGTTKGGKHAYDYLTRWNLSEDWITDADRCADMDSNANAAGGGCLLWGADTTHPIKLDANVAFSNGGPGGIPVPQSNDGSRYFTMRNGTITASTAPTLVSGSYAGDGETVITITFTVGNNADACPTSNNCSVALWFGAHIARTDQWATGGATTVPGSPYHVALDAIDGGSIGQRDNQMQAGAIVLPSGQLTIVKVANPNSPVDFEFNPSANLNSDANFFLDDDDLGGTEACTGGNCLDQRTFTTLEAGVYTMEEVNIPAGWTLTSAECSDGSPVTAITLSVGENVICTFTNTKAPRLKLVKTVTNDNGGTAVPNDWDLIATGSSLGFTELTPASANATFRTVAPSVSYALTETGAANYTQGSFSCNGGTQVGDSVTLANGDEVTCTVNNNDNAPKLTLNKVVVNNNGGTALESAWMLTATGNPVTSPATLSGPGAAGNADVVSGATFDAGTYDLSESGGPANYTASAWVCTGGQVDGDTVTVALGTDITCTITNDDNAPKLTLNKVVVNNNGGTALESAWMLTATGNPVTSPATLSGPGAAGNADVVSGATFDAGTYDLSESGGPANYTASAWVCTGGQVDGDTVTVALGTDITCTITNDDNAPKLTLNKVVVNNNGGTALESAWMLTATGNPVTSPATLSGPGAAGNADVVSGATFDAGTYDLSESGGPANYTASAWVCTGGQVDGDTVTVALGTDITCTITNDDNAPKLTLNKVVVNNNGGTALESAWMLTATGNPVTSPATLSGPGAAGNADVVSGATFDAGTYDLSESGGPANYTASAWVCTGGQVDGDTVTVALGTDITCTITNDDNAPKLTLNKVVVNNNGGTALESAWRLTATGNPVTSPATLSGPGAAGNADVVSGATFDAGTYDLSESGGPAGYSASSWSCTGGQVDGDTVTVALGTDITCTITNDDISPTLTVIKQIVPDTDSGLFNLRIDGVTQEADAGDEGTTGAIPVNAGPHTVSETAGTGTNLSNYDAVISGHCATNGTVTLALAENKVCTITNTRRGKVEVLKLTNGGVHPTLDIRFTLYKDGTDVDPDLTPGAPPAGDEALETVSTFGDPDGILQFTTSLVPGTTYTICENPVPAGWTSLWQIGFEVNGQIVTPYNPNGNDAIPQDLGIRCFDFTVNPGQTAQFEVHNDFPGGDQRTIGYWKNWNRCTGGGQAANADRQGGAAAGFYIVEDLLPQLIGDFNITTCAQAVKVLDKSAQNGKKMASDAAYELAAQLLAAQFNLAAGAGTCAAAADAVVDGQDLLADINFTGSGNYLPSKGGNQALRAEALALASTLDTYNNSNLCP